MRVTKMRIVQIVGMARRALASMLMRPVRSTSVISRSVRCVMWVVVRMGMGKVMVCGPVEVAQVFCRHDFWSYFSWSINKLARPPGPLDNKT
jgi:hypothetical protein